MFSKSLVALSAASMISSAAAIDASVNVWASASCTDDVPAFEAVATVDGCTKFEGSDGTIVYGVVGDCSSENGAWTMAVYLDSTCSATVVGGFTGTDSCDCATGVLGTRTVSARVSCQNTENTCMYYRQWMDNDKCSLDETPEEDGTYISGSCIDNGAFASMVTCDGGSEKSSWSATMYESGSGCTGTEIGSSDGSSCKSCAEADPVSDDFYGALPSLQVNCAGYDWESAGGCKVSAASSTAATIAMSGVVAAGVALGLFL